MFNRCSHVDNAVESRVCLCDDDCGCRGDPCAIVGKTKETSSVAHSGPAGIRTQPMPTDNNLPNIIDLVKQDLSSRAEQGLKTYGVPLRPFNGRNSLLDAYHEILDLTNYIRQKIYEEDGK